MPALHTCQLTRHIHRTVLVTSFFCVFFSGCIKKAETKSFSLQTHVNALEIIPAPTHETLLKLPSFPLRVFAKFVLAGISLDKDNSNDRLKIKRFNQALEYLEAYYNLKERDGSSIQSTAELMSEMHKGLQPQSQFSDEFARLVNPKNDQVILPDASFAPIKLSTITNKATLDTWFNSRKNLSLLMERTNLTQEMASLIAKQSTQAPRAVMNTASDVAMAPLQFLGLGYIGEAFKNAGNSIGNEIFDKFEDSLKLLLQPVVQMKSLEDLENQLRKFASNRNQFLENQAAALSIMNNAEKLFQGLQATVQQRLDDEIKSGLFKTNDVVITTFLEEGIGGYLALLPNEFAKNFISDLIDSAQAEMQPHEILMLAAQSAGPLLKKTMQMYAREQSLTPEVRNIFQSVEKSNEAMDFNDVKASVERITGMQVTKLYEKPVGVGSIADTYRIQVKESAAQDTTSTLDFDAIRKEWRIQNCLAEKGTQAMVHSAASAPGSDPKLSPSSQSMIDALSDSCAESTEKTPTWIKDAFAQDTVPLAVRFIKPSAKKFLEAEKLIFAKVGERFDAKMERLENESKIQNFHLPRIKNILGAVIKNIENELQIEKTVHHHKLARSPSSAYEILKILELDKNNSNQRIILRTRVPQAAALFFSEGAPLSKSGAAAMEFLPGGDFEEALHDSGSSIESRKKLSGELLKMWLRSAVYSGQQIIHADLHSGNILASLFRPSNGEVVFQLSIIDFGMAIAMDAQSLNFEFSDDIITLGMASYLGNTKKVILALRGLADSQSIKSSDPAAQIQKAEAFFKSRMTLKSPPNMEDWFFWVQNELPPEMRLSFTPDVINLISGYIRISGLYARQGAGAEDAINLNKELAFENNNWQKVIKAYGGFFPAAADFVKFFTPGN